MRVAGGWIAGFGALLLGLTAVAPLRAQDTTRAPYQLTVRVVSELEGAPVAYSVVVAPDLGVERFAGANGSAVIPVSQAGRVRLIVKRIGFAPKDTVVSVIGLPTQEVTIALTRVSFTLEAVRVVDWPPCQRPGIPRRGGDPQVRAVVEQLRQNADRFALLARQYPFLYNAERTLGSTDSAGVDSVESMDTTRVNGNPEWRYRPGQLISGRIGTVRQPLVVWTMHIPTIRDLGEDAFVDNHCFHVAGLDEKNGQRLLRLDIVAAERLKTADVNAAVWLDPHDFQLRYATFVLTKVPAQFVALRALSNEVEFVELIPFVPVMQSVFVESVMADLEAGGARLFFERQRILRIDFTKARPEGLSVDPTQPLTPP